MRSQTRDYLKKLLDNHPEIHTCLDVGSMEAGGGRIRDLFEGKEYLGIDMRNGDGVDRVINAHDLSLYFPEESFDLVTCFDTFEHDTAFWLTLAEMKRVVKKGGWMMIGVPSRYCPEHNHPGDYWRFMPQSMKLFFEGFTNFDMILDMDGNNANMEDEVYGWGQK